LVYCLFQLLLKLRSDHHVLPFPLAVKTIRVVAAAVTAQQQTQAEIKIDGLFL
jgi:hypothetical protein